MKETERMTERLSAFVETHPEGWNHDDWTALLADLNDEGVDVTEPDRLGWQLEQVRLAWELRRRSVPGLGPKRIEAVVDRFGTLWNLRQASAEDVAEIPTLHRGLAEKVVQAVR